MITSGTPNNLSSFFTEVKGNKTLFISRFASQAPVNPSFEGNFKTLEEVFAHFKPAVHYAFDPGMQRMTEEICFTALDDFNESHIIEQSSHLKASKLQEQACAELLALLKVSNELSQAVKEPETRKVLAEMLLLVAAALDGKC